LGICVPLFVYWVDEIPPIGFKVVMQLTNMFLTTKNWIVWVYGFNIFIHVVFFKFWNRLLDGVHNGLDSLEIGRVSKL
jgi:hypothetical protein